MERVGEAVGFVANALQHEQRLASAGQVDRLTAPGEVDLLEPFGE